MQNLPRIPVRHDAAYPGRLNTDRSGEVWLGTRVAGEDLVVYHASDDPIEAFRPIETCFYRGYTACGHVYAIHVPAGTALECYPHREVRFTPTPETEIISLGECRLDWVHGGIEIYTGAIAQCVDPEDAGELPATWSALEKKLEEDHS